MTDLVEQINKMLDDGVQLEIGGDFWIPHDLPAKVIATVLDDMLTSEKFGRVCKLDIVAYREQLGLSSPEKPAERIEGRYRYPKGPTRVWRRYSGE